MPEKKTMLTYDGLKRMEEELHALKVERRKEVAEKIKIARARGDLSENAEYNAAKDEQAELEARIIVLEKTLRNAEVIDEEDLSRNFIGIGSKIKVLDIEMDEEIAYTIVGSTEADPLNGRISNESPLGTALLGRQVDDVVAVDAPEGTIEYRVVAIL